MPKKQSKNLRENIGKIWKIQQDKNVRKKHIEKENCQGDLQQENYSDGWIKGTIKNTGEGWKGIGDGGKESNQGKEDENNCREREKQRRKFRSQRMNGRR